MTKRVELPGSKHNAPSDMHAIGRAPGDEKFTVSVYLKDRTGIAAAHAVGAVPDRQSRASLREARETDHAADIDALQMFAKEHGLEVMHSDPARRLVQLSGSTSAIERAFGTELHHYDVNGQTCRARSGALHIPEDVADRIDAVLGLDTRPFATPKIVPHKNGPPPEGFLPTEVAALYGFGDLDASGQCIALIELGGGYNDADNQAAFQAMQVTLPDIVSVSVDGADNAPGASDADGEVALDIQVAGGAAPGVKIAVYFAPNTSQGFVDAVTQAIHDEESAPSAISISWGSPESDWSGQALTAMNAALQDAATLGVTITAASGDALATDGEDDGKAHVDYPASSPYVLGCGGTRITASASTITAEIVWNSNDGGTGGGVSTLFALPAYQQTAADVPAPASSKGGRGVPDVAGNADPDSGYRIIVGGETGIVGGTSAVAPLWAGIVAGCNAQRSAPLGYFHETLYDNGGALNDVSSGNNRVGSVGFAAAMGWDACTGLGSPTARLRQLLGDNPAAAG